MIGDAELVERAVAVTRERTLSPTAEAGGVGCALVTVAGNVYLGVCVDTACSMGYCAEHNAIGTMITAGESHIATIVAVRQDGTILPPCGRCREFIHQVDPGNAQTRVIVRKGTVKPLAELLPDHWMA